MRSATQRNEEVPAVLEREEVLNLIDHQYTMDRPASKRWVILDAKYSQGRQTILGAMHSAHVYHDALRRFDEPPFRSLLLIPALVDDVDWIHERSFKDTHGVGIVTCSPDAAIGTVFVAARDHRGRYIPLGLPAMKIT